MLEIEAITCRRQVAWPLTSCNAYARALFYSQSPIEGLAALREDKMFS
jgi:hypothetical protein